MTLYTINNYNNTDQLNLQNQLKNIINKDTTFICIGSDKFIFDCIGPITGSILQYHLPNLNIIGTLQNPLTAINLKNTINNIPTNNTLIIDAALSNNNINKTILYNEPASPAFGSLGSFGSYKIISYTTTKDNFNPFNNTTRLFDVFFKSNFIANSIINTLNNL